MVTKRKFWQRMTAVFLSAMLFAGTLGNGAAYVKAEELTDGSGAESGVENNQPEEPAGEHKHKICADAECTDAKHTEITWTAWTSSDSLPTEAGSYYLTQDVTLTDSWENSLAINICFHGHIVKIDSPNKSVIIAKAKNLKLTDCSSTEHKFSVDRETGLWSLNETGGTETLTGGCITGARGGEDGGEPCPAVVNEASSSIDMYHINIVGNKNGGEMYLKENNNDEPEKGGSALYSAGAFGLHSGNIVGNYIDMSGIKEYEAEQHAGGCVFIENGESSEFTMNGGKIYKNGGEHNTCGGVFVHGGEFTMTGGEISENTGVMGGGILAMDGWKYASSSVALNGGKITKNYANKGGGIYYYYKNADFIINGVEITGNTAQEGGGVLVNHTDVFENDGIALNSPKFIINGGKITDNFEETLDYKTDEVHKFKSNLFLEKYLYRTQKRYCVKEISLGKDLKEGAKFGITIGGISDNDMFFTRETTAELSENVLSYFESDDPIYSLAIYEGSKRLCLKKSEDESHQAIEALRKQIGEIENADFDDYNTLCNAAIEVYNGLTEDQQNMINYAVLKKLQDLQIRRYFGRMNGGTEEYPFSIGNSNDLKNLQRYVRVYKRGLRGVYFELNADIDIGSDQTEVNVIGWQNNSETGGKDQEITPFLGNFEGNGHAIMGLGYYQRADRDGYVRDCVGLFAHNKGTIKNLTVVGEFSIADDENASDASARDYIGGIAGKNEGKIINCSSIIKINGKDYVGGITGANLENGIIKNCRSADNVKGSGSNVGGIAGTNQGIIKDCSYEKTDRINKNIFGVGGTSVDSKETTAVNDVHVHTPCGESECPKEEGNSHYDHYTRVPRIWKPWSKPDSLPIDGGYYYLTTDVELSEKYISTSELKNGLCLNGHIIKPKAKTLNPSQDKDEIVSEFALIENEIGDLTLTDCSKEKHKFSVGENGLWTLDETNGTKELTGGCITGVSAEEGCSARVCAVGLYQGRLRLYNVNIVGNSSTSSGAGLRIFAKYTSYNYGIYMYSGNIVGNCAPDGAGVYTSRSKFYLYGGTIADNHAANYGGGIFANDENSDDPVINIYGGTISGNSARRGGGVYLGTRQALFLMSGGEIKDNKASELGGGIYGLGQPAFGRGSGKPVTVGDNYVENEEGKIPNNLYLPNNSRMNNKSGTMPGSKIGISTEVLPTEEKPKVYVADVYHAWFSLDSLYSDRTGYMMTLEGANSQNGFVYLVVETKSESEIFMEMINNLGDVTVENVLDKAQSLKEVREAYEKLDQEQAAQVSEEIIKKWNDAETTLADAVKQKINVIGEVNETNVLSKKTVIEEARAAYNKLYPPLVEQFPEDIAMKLTDAEELLAQVSGGSQDTAVEQVIAKINAIGEINADTILGKKALIDEARNAYEALTAEQKKRITEEDLKKLTDAEKLYAQVSGGGTSDAVAQAVAKINTIPSAVTYDKTCKKVIEEARKAYDALSEDQKNQIPEDVLKKLTDAEAEYDRLAAAAVKEKIDAIGEVTAENAEEKGQKIEDARNAYDSLTEKQKEQITPETLKKLTDAEKVYDQATGGKNQAAADRAAAKIDAIPIPVQYDWKCAQKIEEAREAYDSLTGIQKNLVPEDKKQKLIDAEKEYNRLAAEKAKEKIDAIGTVTPENAEEKKQAIEDARDVYDSLTDSQKELITEEEKKKLTDAEKTYDETKGNQDKEAADKVKDKIDAILVPVQDNEETKQKIEDAFDAYENLTGTQKDMVSGEDKKKLEDAKDVYDNLQADKVKDKIDAIGEVTPENAADKKQELEDARDAYDKLTDDQKELITPEEKKELTDAEKVYDQTQNGKDKEAADKVKDKIDAIPDPVQKNEDCKTKIEDAKNAYDSLTGTQKDMVPDSSKKKLENAQNTYDRLAAAEVMEKIDAIGEVTPENSVSKKDLIDDARDAYDKLTDKQKEHVTSEEKKKLTDAEKIYDNATGGHNQAAADSVVEKINAIPDPVKNNADTKQKIDDAREAYDKLTTTQKDMVPESSKKKLESAEKEYQKLLEADKNVVDEVKKKIDAIGEVTPENVTSKKDLIEDAREAYDKLTDGQKEQIEPEEKKKLTDAEKVYDNATGGHNQAAADKVKDKIDAIPSPVRNDEETKQKLEDALEAYDDLTGTQKDMLSEESKEKLEEAEDAYNKLVTDEVEQKIDAIGEVTPENVVSKKDLIEDARDAYDKLNDKQKDLIESEEKKKLTDAEKVYDNATGGHNQAAADKVKDKIDAIPSPIRNDEETKQKLEDALDAYDDLTGTQKDMLPEESKEKLEEAEDAYNKLVTDEVKQKIDAIGEVTPENVVSKKDLIEDARDAYDKLNDKQKDLIESEEKKKLTDAEKIYDNATGGHNQAAADKVKDKIDAIPSPIKNDEETKQKLEDALDAYDDLTGTQKDMLPEESKEKLEEAEDAYNKLVTDEVKQKIDAIGEITPENVVSKKDLIEDARDAYDKLNDKQKELIESEEKKKLTDAEKIYDNATGGHNQAAADKVKDKIDAIPSPIRNDEETKQKLEDAWKAYHDLTGTQKDMLPKESKKKLEEAKTAFDKLAVDEVKKKIDAIGEVTFENAISKKDLIEDARKAYDKLTDSQKEMIDDSKLQMLTDAEKIYGDAVNADNQTKLDQAAVQNVVNKINAIGTVVKTDECAAKIKDARAAYNALTDIQKKMVPAAVLKILTDAESAYAALTNGTNLPADKQEQINNIADKLGVTKETAEKIQALAEELGVEVETLLLTENSFVGSDTENDVKGSNFSLLQLKATNITTKQVTLRWKKVNAADGYQIYGTRCGKGNKAKLIKTIEKNGTTKFKVNKLLKGKAYRYVVRAYKIIDGNKITIAASKTTHIFTNGGKYGNAKTVKVKKAKVTVKKGKTFKVKASEVKAKKPLKRHRKLCYESSNTTVAEVTKKGVIKGKSKGTCFVYVYAQNGVYKKIKVTVK